MVKKTTCKNKKKVTLGISVVGVRYAAESLLAGRVPDLRVKAHNYTAANWQEAARIVQMSNQRQTKRKNTVSFQA